MKAQFLLAALAATALTATAVDARGSARHRGVASGQEAKERMTTRDLNQQQLAGGGPAMAGGNAAMAPAAAPAMNDAGTPPPAPDAGAAPMAPMTEGTPPADAPMAPDAASPPPR